MSSPVHHPDDLDAALRYAPPWARNTATPSAVSPDYPGTEGPPSDAGYDDGEPLFDGDRAILSLQRRLSQDPYETPEPPEPPVRLNDRPTLDRIALRLCAVAGVAALVAWATISLPIRVSLPIKISLPMRPQIDQIVHAATTPALTATPVKVVHIHTEMAPLPVASATPATPAAVPMAVEAAPGATQEPSEAAPVPAAVPVRVAEATPEATQGPLEAAPTPDPPRPAAKAIMLAPDEIAMLVNRGKDFLTNGDISSARLLLRRAAEAGNAEAALALGSTFDPAVIARLGAIGVKADAARARKWYEKAAALGSNCASEQIAKLAQASR